MAIKVAKRARAELGVEPVFVVMLERGAAQHPLFTDSGAQWLRDDPVTFFEVWNPTIFKLYKSAGGWKVHIFSFFSNGLCVYMIIYMFLIRGSVATPNGMVPASPSQNPAFACISEPQSPNRTVLVAFESHMLPTYNIRAAHSIYMLLFDVVCLYTSQAIAYLCTAH